jgi:hypothetical protein
MKALLCAMLIAGMSVISIATAQDTDVLVDRVLRRDIARTSDLFFREADQELTRFTFNTGLSYANGYGSDSSLEIPFGLDYAITENDVISATSGLVRADDGTDRAHGFQDLTLSYLHVQPTEGRLYGIFSAAVIIPAGGDVGSTTATQVVSGVLGYRIADDWQLRGGVALVHVDELPSGIDDIGTSYSASLLKGFKDSKLTATVRRKLREGLTGTTSGELKYDFKLTRDREGSLLVGHVFTDGRSSNFAELSLAFPW